MSGGKRLRKSLADNSFSTMDYPNYGPKLAPIIPRRCDETTCGDNRPRKPAASVGSVAGRSNFTAGRKSVRQRTLRPPEAGDASLWTGEACVQKHQQFNKPRENATSPTTYVRSRGQGSEVRGQRSEVRQRTPDLWPPIKSATPRRAACGTRRLSPRGVGRPAGWSSFLLSSAG